MKRTWYVRGLLGTSGAGTWLTDPQDIGDVATCACDACAERRRERSSE